MDNIIFENPNLLWLLLLLLPVLLWYIFKQSNSQATLTMSSTTSFDEGSPAVKSYFRHILFLLRAMAIALIIVVLARPQTINSSQDEVTKGIDIVLSLDISSSMLAQDFKPNRLEATKDLAINFISGRPLDRIGLVIFSGESFTQCPLTTDHAVLINLFQDIKQGMIEDGTAIGVGLATAVNRLKESEAISKVIILMTDGVNNSGEIAPVTAADLAAKYGIRVYTVGVGKNGMAPYPVQGIFGRQLQQMEVKIDEESLREIAEKTGGQYFRATSNGKLKSIYEEIDKLEKSKIDVKKYSTRHEEYLIFAILAAGLVLLEIVLRQVFFRNLP